MAFGRLVTTPLTKNNSVRPSVDSHACMKGRLMFSDEIALTQRSNTTVCLPYAAVSFAVIPEEIHGNLRRPIVAGCMYRSRVHL